MNRYIKIVCISLFSTLVACSSINDSANSNTLFEQLGGDQGIERLVSSFINKIGNDKQVFPYFAKASVSHFKLGFINHLCDVSGGPCKYKGDSMVDIHTGMNINEADFNRVVELLIAAMEENAIAYPVQNKVLAKLAPLRPEIIKI